MERSAELHSGRFELRCDAPFPPKRDSQTAQCAPEPEAPAKGSAQNPASSHGRREVLRGAAVGIGERIRGVARTASLAVFEVAHFPNFASSVVRKAREILARSVSEGDRSQRVEGVPSLTLRVVMERSAELHSGRFELRCMPFPPKRDSQTVQCAPEPKAPAKGSAQNPASSHGRREVLRGAAVGIGERIRGVARTPSLALRVLVSLDREDRT